MPQGNDLGDVQKNIRPQKAGEAATTRFGMEEGDNSDIPATGGVDDPTEGEPETGADERELKAEEEAARLGDFA